MDELRPDPMQTFYQRQAASNPPVADFEIEEDAHRTPMPPLRIRVRWTGFLILAGFVALCAIVARVFVPQAAELLAVIGLGGLAGGALLYRRKRQVSGSDEGVWIGDGTEVLIAGDVDSGADVGGGGGGD